MRKLVTNATRFLSAPAGVAVLYGAYALFAPYVQEVTDPIAPDESNLFSGVIVPLVLLFVGIMLVGFAIIGAPPAPAPDPAPVTTTITSGTVCSRHEYLSGRRAIIITNHRGNSSEVVLPEEVFRRYPLESFYDARAETPYKEG